MHRLLSRNSKSSPGKNNNEQEEQAVLGCPFLMIPVILGMLEEWL
jgi:hypothetical protein